MGTRERGRNCRRDRGLELGTLEERREELRRLGKKQRGKQNETKSLGFDSHLRSIESLSVNEHSPMVGKERLSPGRCRREALVVILERAVAVADCCCGRSGSCGWLNDCSSA